MQVAVVKWRAPGGADVGTGNGGRTVAVVASAPGVLVGPRGVFGLSLDEKEISGSEILGSVGPVCCSEEEERLI